MKMSVADAFMQAFCGYLPEDINSSTPVELSNSHPTLFSLDECGK